MRRRTLLGGLIATFLCGRLNLLASPDEPKLSLPPFRETWLLHETHLHGRDFDITNRSMVLIRMCELKVGDIFCLRDTETNQIIDGKYFRATSPPLFRDDLTWQISGEEYADYA